ncbi:MAG: undecaprenyl/decaprenyl-phosphate alpha-N-acetylglucosaminyl 1-phosphate transferase [Muribaculaceae bacterium]|nr:undecaprenyl/decaprenyl-phosphate alpha-N-acetylglucosaminyl 1-phosphate transferase [Muribaculaceae bacterium]
MSFWIINYLIIIILSTLLAAIIIPKILLIAFRCNLYDAVDERKIHKGVVPRLGGISFLPSLGVSVCLCIGINMRFFPAHISSILDAEGVQLLFLASALLMIYLLGIADDLMGVRYRAKFLFQTIGGILIVLSGLWAKDLYGFLWITEVAPWVGWILTVFLVIYVLNAINLIDGIDGLASGLSLMAFIWYAYIFYIAGDYISMLIAGATLGTLIPFFYYNVFGKASTHTKIFMGDTGSLTIGLILVFLTLRVANLSSAPEWGNCDYNLFILAIAPIIIPCFDVVRVFLHRIRQRRNPFLPDKSHIHHKLLALGFAQSKALIVILLWDAILIVLNFWLSLYIEATWIVLADVVIWTVLNLYLTASIRRRERKLGQTLYQ